MKEKVTQVKKNLFVTSSYSGAAKAFHQLSRCASCASEARKVGNWRHKRMGCRVYVNIRIGCKMVQRLSKSFYLQTSRFCTLQTQVNISALNLESTVHSKPAMLQGALRPSVQRGNSRLIHTSTCHGYMMAKLIPLPENIEDIAAAEKAQFSPQRSRDISGPVILSKTMGTFVNKKFATGYNSHSQPSDPRLASYDCRGLVSLHSSMQTNVPEPFCAKGKATHLNMPGGQWGQGYKYISDDLQNFHYWNLSQQGSSGIYFKRQKFYSVVLLGGQFHLQRYAPYSTSVDNNKYNNKLTNKEKLKRALKEYGSTVIIFHVGLSLLSLGGCYLAVSSGIDVNSGLQSWGAPELAADASIFIIAYAIHKAFAPVRIGITLACTPFIVSYLRKVGFLKIPK